MDDTGLLELAARLARQAGDAIMGVRRAGFAVERKRDFSPVTAADRLAEALVTDGLREGAPGIPIVAEEAVEAGLVAGPPAGRFWLVDPLDGTRDFAGGHDSFAVNIGLVEGGRPVLGAVAIPATGEVFAGRVGSGAWKEDAAGLRTPIRARAIPAEGPVVMASRHHADDPRYLDFAREHRAARVVNIGSAEKFCRLAEGTADLYPRFGTTMEWDTAAPEAVLIAAGGHVGTWEGTPLAYGKAVWRNPPFLARGAV